MEKIPINPYLKFHPDTLQAVRKEFNLHQPGAMEEAIKSFEEWIEKQNHFVKRNFSKHFIECTIVLSKGSLERAKKSLDKLCTLKTLIPKFFLKYDAKHELMDLSTYMLPALLPKLTDDNYRIFISKIVSSDIDTPMFYDYYRFITLMCEYMKANDYLQGFIAIADVRDVNVVNYALKLNVIDLRHLIAVMMEGYGMRLKGIHLISESKTIDALVSVVKQIVSPKLGGRIQVHKNLESLYKCVPQDALPEEYGGKEKPLKGLYNDMVDLFSTKENVEYFKEISQPGTNEAFRHTAKFNEEILGMPGSFRSLTVD